MRKGEKMSEAQRALRRRPKTDAQKRKIRKAKLAQWARLRELEAREAKG